MLNGRQDDAAVDFVTPSGGGPNIFVQKDAITTSTPGLTGKPYHREQCLSFRPAPLLWRELYEIVNSAEDLRGE